MQNDYCCIFSRTYASCGKQTHADTRAVWMLLCWQGCSRRYQAPYSPSILHLPLPSSHLQRCRLPPAHCNAPWLEWDRYGFGDGLIKHHLESPCLGYLMRKGWPELFRTDKKCRTAVQKSFLCKIYLYRDVKRSAYISEWGIPLQQAWIAASVCRPGVYTGNVAVGLCASAEGWISPWLYPLCWQPRVVHINSKSSW